jgi:hypothetical protein
VVAFPAGGVDMEASAGNDQRFELESGSGVRCSGSLEVASVGGGEEVEAGVAGWLRRFGRHEGEAVVTGQQPAAVGRRSREPIPAVVRREPPMHELLVVGVGLSNDVNGIAGDGEMEMLTLSPSGSVTWRQWSPSRSATQSPPTNWW